MLIQDLTNATTPLSRQLRKSLSTAPAVKRVDVRDLAKLLDEQREAANGMRAEPVERSGDDAAAVAQEIVTLARAAVTLAELQCSGFPQWDAKLGRNIEKFTGEDGAALEAMRDAIKDRIRDIGAAFGVQHVHIAGDPRGHVLKLEFLSGKSNRNDSTWGVR